MSLKRKLLILTFFNDNEYKFDKYNVDIYIPEFNTAIMINENEYISL